MTIITCLQCGTVADLPNGNYGQPRTFCSSACTRRYLKDQRERTIKRDYEENGSGESLNKQVAEIARYKRYRLESTDNMATWKRTKDFSLDTEKE